MNSFVIGDIHGRFEALQEVLKKSNFDFNKDKLIVLGDVCDGDEYVKECIDTLLKVKNLVFVLGNHDVWALDWMKTGKKLKDWWFQGGMWTSKSYSDDYKSVPKEHINLLENARLYYLENDCLFVHGGFNTNLPIEKQEKFTFVWDRSIINYAMKNKIKNYKKVYIGHTTTEIFCNNPNIKDCMSPITFNNLVMLDTGGGWTGRLSMINLDNGEVFRSKIQIPKK